MKMMKAQKINNKSSLICPYHFQARQNQDAEEQDIPIQEVQLAEENRPIVTIARRFV